VYFIFQSQHAANSNTNLCYDWSEMGEKFAQAIVVIEIEISTILLVLPAVIGLVMRYKLDICESCAREMLVISGLETTDALMGYISKMCRLKSLQRVIPFSYTKSKWRRNVDSENWNTRYGNFLLNCFTPDMIDDVLIFFG
jgi:hypothetical protein